MAWGFRGEHLTWTRDSRDCRIQFVRLLGMGYFLLVSLRSEPGAVFLRTFWRRSLYRWVEWEPGAHIHNRVELEDFVLRPSCRVLESLVGLNSKKCTKVQRKSKTRQMVLNVLRKVGTTVLPVQNGSLFANWSPRARWVLGSWLGKFLGVFRR